MGSIALIICRFLVDKILQAYACVISVYHAKLSSLHSEIPADSALKDLGEAMMGVINS